MGTPRTVIGFITTIALFSVCRLLALRPPSLTLCRSLLNAGLVDRFRVVVFAVISGTTGQDRIYDGYPDVALDMIRSCTFDGRTPLLEYAPTVLSGPPAADTGVER